MNRYRKLGVRLAGLACLAVCFTSSLAQSRPVVAVIPFNNTSNNQTYGYLSGSLADAVNTSIVRLKRFAVLDRGTITQTAAGLGSGRKELTKKEAAEIADELDADFFILGNFIAIGKSIQINARIIRLSDLSDLSGAKVNGAIDSNIFTTIDLLADKLAANLDKAVPVTQTRRKLARGNTQLYLLPTAFIPMTELADSFGPGMGGALELGRDHLFFRNSYFGLRGGYNLHRAEVDGMDSFSVIPVTAHVGYNLVFSSRLYIRPFAGGGMHFGRYLSSTNEVNYRLGAAVAGMQAGFFIFENVNLALNMEADVQFGKSSHLFLVTGLGLTWHMF